MMRIPVTLHLFRGQRLRQQIGGSRTVAGRQALEKFVGILHQCGARLRSGVKLRLTCGVGRGQRRRALRKCRPGLNQFGTPLPSLRSSIASLW